MNQARRYQNPQWLTQPAEHFWKDSERRKWSQLYNESISHMLKSLGLIGDNNALSLAKNLWHSANADEQTIQIQLQKYKEYKSLREDTERLLFA